MTTGAARRPLATLILAMALVPALAGCGFAARVVEPPPPSVAPSPSVSSAQGQTRAAIVAALGTSRVQVEDARVPYRPGESPALAAAPRIVLHAILPDAPDDGFIVIYDLPDSGAAAAAARELAEYVATGPGSIQFPLDARFTIRQAGSTVVVHHWSPASSTDPEGEERIATALASIGQGYEVRR